MKKSKRKYSKKKFENLFFAVTQCENEDYKYRFNILADVELTKRKIFTNFTEYLETQRRDADMILKKV
jgi:hypothetical protein